MGAHAILKGRRPSVRCRGRQPWPVLWLLVLLLVGASGAAATWWLGKMAYGEVVTECKTDKQALALLLDARLSAVENSVRVLSGSPSLRAVLDDDLTPASLAQANETLDRYCSGYQASVCYLMGFRGIVLASSNRNDVDSFVGHDYSFRPYFTRAVKEGSARYFALGVTSGKRGFYAAAAIRNKEGDLRGVIVIKEDIEEMCDLFQMHPGAFLVDANGVILMASRPEWVFRTLRPLDKEKVEALRESRQFGEGPFQPAPVSLDDFTKGGMGTLAGRRSHAETHIIGPDAWTLLLFSDLHRVTMYRAAGGVVTCLLMLLLISFFVVLRVHDRANETLVESEAKYRRLIETTDTGYLTLDGYGRVVDANQEYVRLTGHRELREILGKSVTEWTAEHAKTKNAEAVTQCLQDRHIRNLVVDYVDGRGMLTPVEISATVEGEGESLRIISLCRDITERKRDEAELIFKNNLLAIQQETFPDAILVVDGEAKIISYNRQFIELFKIPSELVEAQIDEPVLQTVTSQMADQEGFLSKVRHLYANREEKSVDELSLTDGRIIERYSAPVIGGSGHYYGRIWIFRDITERKQAVAELQRSKEKLENSNRLLEESVKRANELASLA